MTKLLLLYFFILFIIGISLFLLIFYFFNLHFSYIVEVECRVASDILQYRL